MCHEWVLLGYRPANAESAVVGPTGFQRNSRTATDRPNALRDSLRAHLNFKGASIPDLRIYNRYLPGQHLRFEGRSGVLSGDLHLDARGEIGRGWIRVAGMTLRGDIGIDTRLRRADLANRNFAVDGSAIALDNISFSEPGGEWYDAQPQLSP